MIFLVNFRHDSAGVGGKIKWKNCLNRKIINKKSIV